MINSKRLLSLTSDSIVGHWYKRFHSIIEKRFSNDYHGDYTQWKKSIDTLPTFQPVTPVILDGAISFIGNTTITDDEKKVFDTLLMKLHPWRKGPYNLHGIIIETEWRSDLKWNRLQNHITPLLNRKVLDIGCGSGYHCWRMVMDGAAMVIGIEPYLLSVMQFNAVKSYSTSLPIFILPIGMDELPVNNCWFDTVFSMGLLYHRRSPIDHIISLKGYLRQGGELILETLVIDGENGKILVPDGRYAKMRNVWFIPTILTLEGWLKKCGFKNIRMVHSARTTSNEQRKTSWMQYESLDDFLDPLDNTKTIEGYPAPMRAIFIADRP